MATDSYTQLAFSGVPIDIGARGHQECLGRNKKEIEMKRFTTAVAVALLTLSGAASADIVDLTLDAKGTVALGGTLLLISGTVTCDPPSSFTSIPSNVIQISVGGKVVSRAFAFGFAQCAGAAEPVPYTLQANAGFFGGSPFKPGPADVSVTAQQFVCLPTFPFTCFFSTKTVAQKVILNP